MTPTPWHATIAAITLALLACKGGNNPAAGPPNQADVSPLQPQDALPSPTTAADAKTQPRPNEKDDAPTDFETPPAEVAAVPADATITDSGLGYKVLKTGDGEYRPQKWDKVRVHYAGWTTDGKMFDSSKKRGRPATFEVRQVIPGWMEGLQLMRKGDVFRFWLPKNLAYNDKPGRPMGTLVFDVVLLDVFPGPKPIAAPEDVGAPPADAQKTPSGLAYKILTPGQGDRPAEQDKVEVHYSGWMTDGEMFDSSVQRGKPATFKLSAVIKGWTEGLQLMREGAKARFWIPAHLAYGDRATRPGAPYGTLVFDVELLRIIKMPAPPATPPDVAEIPADATQIASGLAYRVLREGTGQRKPAAYDRVEVHYTGWTTDGKMFDSSITRGRPATFGVSRVIEGWTEGLQLMVEGETRRFWIPAALAYGETPRRPGAPAGMLVFDVELLKIYPVQAPATRTP